MSQATLRVTDANNNIVGLEQTALADLNQVPNVLLTDENSNRVKVDAVNNLSVENGGRSATLNIGAAVAVKASAGRIRRVIINAPGSTGGAFTLNNCATTGAAAAGNQIWTMAYNAAANVAGAIFEFDWPCDTGITLSAVPTGGTPLIAISYD